MNREPSVKGIILAHGAMAKGLGDAVARISGVGEEALRAVSNDGKSPETLQSEVDDLLGTDPVIIFTDLPSGSCAVTARVCCREGTDAAVISGVNLPILLDFVFHRDLPLEELVPRLLEKGRGSVQSVPDYAHRTLPG
jgi:mannose/fructose-specific phosphotransferase system component IIA